MRKDVFNMMKKKSPFTGLPINTAKSMTNHSSLCLCKFVFVFVRRAGLRWLLSFEDKHGVEQVFFHSDVTHFSMTTSVRWFSMLSPDLKSAKKLKIFCANPLVFEQKATGVVAQELRSEIELFVIP